MSRNRRPKRRDEEFARQAFDRWLVRHRSESVGWEDGDEPPDYTLRLSDEGFAVEVTSIVETLDLGHGVLSTTGIRASLEGFERSLERAAQGAGLLHGTYVLYMDALPDLPRLKRELMQAALAFIEEVRDVPATEPHRLHARPSCHWTIQKIRPEGCTVVSGIGGGCKWLAEAKSELPGLVSTTLKRKQERLSAVDQPLILLLIDRFVWLDSPAWAEIVGELPETQNFHTVARVWGNHDCQVLSGAWSQPRASHRTATQ